MSVDVRALLRSERPRERATALDLLRTDPDRIEIEVLRTALHAESIPSLRRQIERLIRERLSSQRQPSETMAVPRTLDLRFEEEAVQWLNHELAPGIGFLKLVASDEVESFEESATLQAIDNLERRIEGVAALIRASAPLRPERVSLEELLAIAVRVSGVPQHRVSVDVSDVDGDDEIVSDERLLTILLSNALRNAGEAISGGTDGLANVSAARLGGRFWIRITNSFDGIEFSYDEVSDVGVSNKIDHQGQGISIMRLVADRLGYELSLSGVGGLAVFTLKGRSLP